MRVTVLLSVSALFVSSAGVLSAREADLGELADRLDAIERYDGSARYGVLLPSAADDIVYDVKLHSIKTEGDELSPCDYLIEWTLPTPSGESSGFSAYASKNHFRYRDERLQEYHYDWDSIPFVTGRGGVQRNAQFAEILPQFLASQLRTIADDQAYSYTFAPDTVYGGQRVALIDAVETRNGYTAREMQFVFDADTALPIKIELENNPGAISEQTVTIEFSNESADVVESFDEDALIDRYPDVFERYRQSNFRVENLPGTLMPTFSLPTTAGRRYTHHKGEKFVSPVIVAVLDPSVGSTEETVGALRSAVGSLPMNVDLIFAFVSNNADQIGETVSEAGVGETVLMTARSLARDCGVTSFPTLIFVDRDGMVKDTHLGFNKDLSNVVIQKAALIGR